MCGSLRLEKTMNKLLVGDIIPSILVVDATGYPINREATWEGFARVDGAAYSSKQMKDQWPETHHRVVTIRGVDYFTEVKRGTIDEVKFPLKGAKIAALLDARGQVRILTRPSISEFEKSIHHRMPVRTNTSVAEFIRFLNSKLGTNYR